MMRTPRPTRSIAAALTLGLAACADHPLAAPEAGDPVLTARVSSAATRGPAMMQIGELHSFADLSRVAGASATLVRHAAGMRFTVQTSGLPAGDAITVWWVIFNHPENCQHPAGDLMACSEPDLFDENVTATVLFGAGNVIGGSGKGNFAGSLRTGDLVGCQPPFGEFGLCRDGLVNPAGAEVHLVVRTHGPLIQGLAQEQIRTFAGGCTAETSFGAGTGPNACDDLQFAIFRAP